MNEKTIKLLEYDIIRSRAASCAMSAEAGAVILNEDPLSDNEGAMRLRELVSACLGRMYSTDEEKRDSIPDISGLLPKLDVDGAVLEIDEVYALGLFIDRGETLRTWIGKSNQKPGQANPAEQENPISITAARLPDVKPIAAQIFRVLDKDGNLRDLPEFQAYRRRILALTKELESAGAKFTSNDDTRRMLQSLVPSQRDGRMVLAVKANYRGRIRGIVHEVSSTGQTLFVEPEEVVEKNNDLLIEKRGLDAEIRRVLRELTGKIAAEREKINEFHTGIIYLETIRARARYGFETRGIFAQEGEAIILKKARHPLLGSKAIPLDFSLAQDKRTVIITGPNTGGKTVALKTAGLLAMMNQSGLPVPAELGTTLPCFDGIYADIGDEQSISQSLSTFSSHMTNIADILSKAGSKSLVLLDELGSGTDPQEGTAIAMSILDHFIELKSRLIITTHHGILKNYGYTREGAENASMEFDGRTLAPTFRIVMGIPGESRALDIAERNGLPSEIIKKARNYLAEEQADISALIEGLRKKHKELDAAMEEGRAEEEQLREERRRADLKELRLRQKELQLKSGTATSLHLLLEESRVKLENLVRELKEGEITRDKTLKVKEFLSGFEESVDAENAELEAEEKIFREEQRRLTEQENELFRNGYGKKVFKPGMEVLAGENRRRGRIIRQDKKGKKEEPQSVRWIVEIGSLKMSFDETEMSPAPSMGKAGIKTGANAAAPAADWAADLAPAAPARMEINLLGMRADEALDVLRRQIDAAVLAGMGSFSVVHGKGDGILQKTVHDYLKNEKAVADYFFSRPELGGFGRTEVTLNLP
ncbi:MAG: endonuclease MutS2 [Treponema sp.]|nr:endonuclease MutS2 [Treponema sp.]